jgi:hypothetical protein
MLQPAGRQNPLVEKHQRLLMADQRTPAERAGLGEEPDGVLTALLSGVDVVRLTEREKSGPGHRSAVGQCSGRAHPRGPTSTR